MLDIAEKNYKVIRKYIVNEKIKIKEWKQQEIKNVFFDKETKQFYWKKNDYLFCMNSENSLNEIEFLLGNIKLKQDNLYIIFGVYHYELIKKIVKESSVQSRVIIIEPNLESLCLAFTHYNYADLFQEDKIALFAGKHLENTISWELQSIRDLGWNNLLYNTKVILPPVYQCYKKFAYKCVKLIHEMMTTEIYNLGNSMEDVFEGFRNTYRNVKAFANTNTFEEIRGKYVNVPAIIVSAGPSLDKNIQYLKRAEGKALILSCDACARACENIGVVPDVVASVERVKETYEFYYKDRTFNKKTVLVAPTVLYPKILQEYPGKKLLAYKIAEGPDAWVAKHFEKMSFNNLGISCAHSAFKLAIDAGCNPIIFIGQDLAFTDEKIHSDSAHTAYEGENDDAKFDGNYVEDINGNMIKTNDIYNWFRNWFEYMISAYSDRIYIDATEGGAKIEGTVISKFSEVVEKYCIKKVEPLYSKLADCKWNQGEYIETLKRLLESANHEIDVLKDVKSKTEMYLGKLEQLFNENYERMEESELLAVIKSLAEGNELIIYLREQENIGNYFKQHIKQTIVHVRRIGNELTPKNVKRNVELQGHLFYMVKNSCDVIIKEYEEMKEFVKMEIEKEQNNAR